MSSQEYLPTSSELDQFEEVTFQEAKERFEQLLTDHSDKSFYGFYLYTTDDVRYLSIGAFIKGEDDTPSTKWSPCDALLHSKYGFLEKAQTTIWWFLKGNEELELDDEEFEQISTQHKERLLTVMKRLDEIRVFPIKQDKDSYVLNVLMGDQDDEERVRFAHILNSQEIADQYEQELEAMYS